MKNRSSIVAEPCLILAICNDSRMHDIIGKHSVALMKRCVPDKVTYV